MDNTIGRLFLEAKTRPVSYKGQVLVRVDRFPVGDGERIRIVREHVGSKWRQAVKLKSDLPLEINNEESTDFVLWSDTAPPEVICRCRTRKGEITVYNAWDHGNGSTDAWIGNAAMIVEELPMGRRYRCNDSQLNDDFDDLVFRIERLSQ